MISFLIGLIAYLLGIWVFAEFHDWILKTGKLSFKRSIKIAFSLLWPISLTLFIINFFVLNV